MRFLIALFVAFSTFLPQAALAEVQTGKILVVMESKLAIVGPGGADVHHFDISKAAIFRNGLPTPPAGLASGDWVTVTTETQDGREVATLVEAGSDRHADKLACDAAKSDTTPYPCPRVCGVVQCSRNEHHVDQPVGPATIARR
jgi:hypothetical protein